jgi:hypothetical protein
MLTFALSLASVGLILRNVMKGAIAVQTAPRIKIERNELKWRLQRARIIDTGASSHTRDGELVTGVVIEAEAISEQNLSIKRGKFSMTASIFSPVTDVPCLKAGKWYLRGDWTIINQKSSPQEIRAGYRHAVVKGIMLGEISFNPFESKNCWREISLQAIVPMSIAAGTRTPPQKGGYSGMANFEGQLIFGSHL